MKSEIRELLADFKAAARIGHPESLQVALDGLRSMPEAASNAAFDESFQSQVVFPLGAVLAHPRLRRQDLLELLGDPLTAVRALAAVALAARYFEGEGREEDLRRAGQDSREEVRDAAGKALGAYAGRNPAKLFSLVSTWLAEPSHRLRQTALLAAPALIASHAEKLLSLVAGLQEDPDPGVQSALVALLIALAGAGHAEAVLALLSDWSGEPDPNAWTISKVLSASWAAGHARSAVEILERLEARTGRTRYVTNALRALERHSAK